jgi:hypothetical protein
MTDMSSKVLLISLAVLFAAARSAVSAEIASAPEAGACVPGEAAAAPCVSTGTLPAAPAWEAELEKARKAGEACQAEIDRFCEGVQVGGGRIEACLKAHQKKLSKKCRQAL